MTISLRTGARLIAVCAGLTLILLSVNELSTAVNVHDVATNVRAFAGVEPATFGVLFVSGLLLGCALFPMSVFAIICGLALAFPYSAVLVLMVASLSAGIEQRVGSWLLARRDMPRLALLVERVRPCYQGQGTIAVVSVKMAPFLPFALTNYAMGAFSLRVREVVLGTMIAVAPRTLLFVGVAGSVRNGHVDLFTTSGLLFGIVPSCLGAVLLARLVRHWRASLRDTG